MRKVFLLAGVLIAMLATAGSVTAAGGRSLTTTLTGAEECTPLGVCNQGDLDGTGTAVITLNSGQGEVCWQIAVSDILLPASAAHIHVAPAGVPGPVVVSLTAPGADGMSSGCTSVDPELIKAIRKAPDSYYVNVHNADYPAGAVRGQLGD